jgi:hypothetical protein
MTCYAATKRAIRRGQSLRRSTSSTDGLSCSAFKGSGAVAAAHSLLRKIAAMTRGLRFPCTAAITHNGFSSGA